MREEKEQIQLPIETKIATSIIMFLGIYFLVFSVLWMLSWFVVEIFLRSTTTINESIYALPLFPYNHSGNWLLCLIIGILMIKVSQALFKGKKWGWFAEVILLLVPFIILSLWMLEHWDGFTWGFYNSTGGTWETPRFIDVLWRLIFLAILYFPSLILLFLGKIKSKQTRL